MARTLEGKLAIVTGASRGIGEAIASKLASYGANIVLGYTSLSSKPNIEALAEDLESKYSVKTLSIRADLGTANGPKSFIETIKGSSAVLKPNGPFQIDILVNNAGVAHNNLLPAITVDQPQNRTFRTTGLVVLSTFPASVPRPASKNSPFMAGQRQHWRP
ncbi:hypothetical protein O1611_g9245 [Lasiodiplodia mahajangana]|uniref:Uncharacterized protein n=1 Tax=Lasiodiplodia mahajangana TaxID=1108764 RepID=A0ACC2JA85_9PEZI|nr:hypothetical protein O1611_g9245 [Lasiodiplodia mahajangana]